MHDAAAPINARRLDRLSRRPIAAPPRPVDLEALDRHLVDLFADADDGVLEVGRSRG